MQKLDVTISSKISDVETEVTQEPSKNQFWLYSWIFFKNNRIRCRKFPATTAGVGCENQDLREFSSLANNYQRNNQESTDEEYERDCERFEKTQSLHSKQSENENYESELKHSLKNCWKRSKSNYCGEERFLKSSVNGFKYSKR